MSGMVGIVASLWLLYMTGSRNGLLGFVIVLIVLAVYGIRWLRTTSFQRFVFIFPIMIIGIGLSPIVMVPNEATSKLWKKIEQLQSVQNYEQLEDKEFRFVLYRSALETGWNHNSLLGSGPKTAGYMMAKHSDSRWSKDLEKVKETYNAHNALLTLLLEMGWIGLILSLAFLIEWFRRNRTAPALVLGTGIILCLGQIFDYFIWQITFMTVQSFAFTLIAATTLSSKQFSSE